MVLAVCVVGLAVLGLTPSLAWIPEVPLLSVTFLVPVAACAVAGYRAGRRTRSPTAGAIAGAVCGAIGGLAGGLAYVALGKSVLNVLIGTFAGMAGGAAVGALAARVRRRAVTPGGE